MDSALPRRTVADQNLNATGPLFAAILEQDVNTGAFKPEVVMANETELFFLLVIIVLTMVMHFILARKGPGADGRNR